MTFTYTTQDVLAVLKQDLVQRLALTPGRYEVVWTVDMQEDGEGASLTITAEVKPCGSAG